MIVPTLHCTRRAGMCGDTISNTQVVLAEINLQAIKKQLKHPFISFFFLSLVPCFKNTNCNNSLNLHTSTFEISYYNIMLFNNISTQISVVLILTLVMASDRYQRYRTGAFSLSSKIEQTKFKSCSQQEEEKEVPFSSYQKPNDMLLEKVKGIFIVLALS